MRPRTLLLLLLSLVLLVPLVAAYGLWSIDSSYIRSLIVTRVEQATGRSFTIDGPVEVRWSLHPTFALSRIALANTSGAAEPRMVTADRLVLQVAALSLLSGRPDLERLSLSGLDMLLESGADGGGNWVFQPESQPSAELVAADAVPVDPDSLPLVRQILITDARVRYCDEAGVTTELKLARAALDASTTDASASFGLAGSLDGKPLRSSGRLGSIDALIDGHGMPLTVTDLALALGGSDLAGSVSLRWDGKRPRVEADLTADRLDLHELDARPDAAGRAVDDAVLFSRSPLPFDALFRLDLQLRLRAASVRTSIGELAQMKLSATLDAGQLNVHPLAFRLSDGPVGGAIMIDAADEPARVELKLSGDDLDLGRLLTSFAPDATGAGRGAIRLQAVARGRTPHALAASATGSGTVLIGTGMLPSDLLSRFASGLHRQFADATGPGRAMVLQCAVLNAQAKKGLARMGLLAEGPEGMVVGGGTIDLDRELVDLTLTLQARQPDLDTVVPIAVRGPLAGPAFGLAEGEAPRRAASLLEAVIFPPAALRALVDLGGAEGDACLELAAHPERLGEPVPANAGSDIVDRSEGPGLRGLDEVRPAP